MISAVIVGGGIVGLATAIKLRTKYRTAKITIVEKEVSVGLHQSTHNSGVLHCGLYYKPGSLKAKLAVSGIREMTAFCRAHEVPHEICGKLVVATNEMERSRLDELLRRGEANGLKGLKKLDRAGMLAVEPHVAGLEAAHVPEEGIVDYRSVCDAMRKVLLESDVNVMTGTEIVAIERGKSNWIFRSKSDSIEGQWLVNTAGLYCDKVSELAGEKRDVQIVPFRGEYYTLNEQAKHLCRHLIYPVPDPSFPFLGVHFTRLIHGGIEAGPNAVLAFAREGYRKRDVHLREFAETLAFPGLWRFMKRYPQMAFSEIAQSLSRKRFCKSLQKLIPDIQADHLTTGGAGVRAQAMTRQGELVQDFHIVRRDYALHVLNAPSPAATASLAIGQYLTEWI